MCFVHRPLLHLSEKAKWRICRTVCRGEWQIRLSPSALPRQAGLTSLTDKIHDHFGRWIHYVLIFLLVEVTDCASHEWHVNGASLSEILRSDWLQTFIVSEAKVNTYKIVLNHNIERECQSSCTKASCNFWKAYIPTRAEFFIFLFVEYISCAGNPQRVRSSKPHREQLQF